jgi:quercetin dioxygenase-like cupin family protein
MSDQRRTPSRAAILASIVAAGVVVAVAGRGSLPAVAAQQSNFVGGTPSQLDAKAIRTLRLKFVAGSRSNWHSHSAGQLLMVEEGRGRTQERGGPLLEMGPGTPWHTKAGVEHWHGAAPDQDVVQLTIYEGEVKWLEPVTDAAYKAPPGKK